MSAGRARVRLVCILGLVLGAIPVLADPAPACSCGGLAVEEELANGAAVAIATRVDTGATTRATFRIERSYGADLPPTLTGDVDGGMGCEPQVFPQQLTALVFRREGGWVLPSCSELNPSDVLARFEGAPSATSSEPAIVLATGDFGGRGFVSLDRFGQAVGWAGPGTPPPAEATACPGGGRFVTFGHAAKGGFEFAVYDVVGLRLRRTVPVQATSEYETGSLKCLDSAGDTLEMRLGEDGDDRWSQLRVRGSKIAKEPIDPGRVYAAGATRILDGDRVVEVEPGDPRAVSDNGERPNVVRNVVLAPDGRTAVAHTVGSYDADFAHQGDTHILIFDRETGDVRARWLAPSHVNQLAWTSAGLVVARVGYGSGYGAPYRAGEVLRFDRDLRVVSRDPGPAAGSMTVIGDSAVFWGGAPLTAVSEGGRTLVAEDLRLVSTDRLLPLSGLGFAPGPERTAAADPSIVASTSTDRSSTGVLLGLGCAALAGALAARLGRARG